MALTVTTLNNAVALTAGGISNAVKTTFQAASTAFRLHASITNGAKAGNPQNATVLRFCVSPISVTAAQAAIQFQQQADRLDLQPPAAPGEIQCRATDLRDAYGTYLYTWLESPLYDVAETVSVIAVEG